MSTFTDSVSAERDRQVDLGHTAEADDEFRPSALIHMATDYLHGRRGAGPRDGLVKATALLVAAGESFDRAEEASDER